MRPELSALRQQIAEIEARKPLTRREALAVICEQAGGVPCGCGCGEKLDPLGEGVVDEHVRALGLLGTNDLENRRFYRAPCARRKTDQEDTPRMAKAPGRLRGTARPAEASDPPARQPVASGGLAQAAVPSVPRRQGQEGTGRRANKKVPAMTELSDYEATIRDLRSRLSTAEADRDAWKADAAGQFLRTLALREALRAIVEFCDDPAPGPESLALGLSRLLVPARRALAKATKPQQPPVAQEEQP